MCSKILEIHADNKDLALDLGKILLKLVAADPDTVEAKFAEIFFLLVPVTRDCELSNKIKNSSHSSVC